MQNIRYLVLDESNGETLEVQQDEAVALGAGHRIELCLYHTANWDGDVALFFHPQGGMTLPKLWAWVENERSRSKRKRGASA